MSDINTILLLRCCNPNYMVTISAQTIPTHYALIIMYMYMGRTPTDSTYLSGKLLLSLSGLAGEQAEHEHLL